MGTSDGNSTVHAVSTGTVKVLTNGIWRRCVQTTFGFSFVLAVADATACGPDEIAGRLMVPSRLANETARYTHENRLNDMYRIARSIEREVQVTL